MVHHQRLLLYRDVDGDGVLDRLPPNSASFLTLSKDASSLFVKNFSIGSPRFVAKLRVLNVNNSKSEATPPPVSVNWKKLSVGDDEPAKLNLQMR